MSFTYYDQKQRKYYNTDGEYDDNLVYKKWSRDGYRFGGEDLSSHCDTFDISEIHEEYRKHFWPELRRRNIVVLGSYSYAQTGEKEKTTIIIPGSPNIWLEPTLPFTLNHDEGLYYTDRNASLFPEFPMLPALVAATECTPSADSDDDFDWPLVDFFTDRDTLRKLFKLVKFKDTRKNKESHELWRVDVQLAGVKTVILSRWEPLEQEKSRGYGFSFKKFASKPIEGCENAEGHYHIIAYDLGLLNIVERFEVDAYLPEDSAEDGVAGVEQLSESSIGDFNVKNRKDLHGLEILRAGSLRSHDSLVELMTARVHIIRTFDWPNEFAQLSQTPNVFVAIQNSGKVDRLRKYKLGEAFRRMTEPWMEESFMTLELLLEKIQRIVIEAGSGKKLSLLLNGSGRLELYERKEGKSCLPDDWLKLFDSPK